MRPDYIPPPGPAPAILPPPVVDPAAPPPLPAEAAMVTDPNAACRV